MSWDVTSCDESERGKEGKRETERARKRNELSEMRRLTKRIYKS